LTQDNLENLQLVQGLFNFTWISKESVSFVTPCVLQEANGYAYRTVVVELVDGRRSAYTTDVAQGIIEEDRQFPAQVFVTDLCNKEPDIVLANGHCLPCPAQGAQCPGGGRIWPTAGYFNFGEMSGFVEACSDPSEARCLGGRDSKCGLGYTGEFCAACSPGYFEDGGACILCDDPSSQPIVRRRNASGLLSGGALDDAYLALRLCILLTLFLAPTLVLNWTFGTLSTFSATLAIMGGLGDTQLADSLASLWRNLRIVNLDGHFLRPGCAGTSGMADVYWASLLVIWSYIWPVLLSNTLAGVLTYLLEWSLSRHQARGGVYFRMVSGIVGWRGSRWYRERLVGSCLFLLELAAFAVLRMSMEALWCTCSGLECALGPKGVFSRVAERRVSKRRDELCFSVELGFNEEYAPVFAVSLLLLLLVAASMGALVLLVRYMRRTTPRLAYSHVRQLGSWLTNFQDAYAYAGILRTLGIPAVAALSRSIPDSRGASLAVVLVPLLAYMLFLVLARPMRSAALLNIDLSTAALLVLAAVVKYSFRDLSAPAQTGALALVLTGMLYVALLQLLLFKATFVVWQQRVLHELSKGSGLVGLIARGCVSCRRRGNQAYLWFVTHASSARVHPEPESFTRTIPEPQPARSRLEFAARAASLRQRTARVSVSSDVQAAQLASVFCALERVFEAIVASACHQNCTVEQLIEMIDVDSVGKLRQDRIKAGFSEVGLRLSDAEATALLLALDTKGDGAVSIAELRKLLDEFVCGKAGVWQTGPRAELITQNFEEELTRNEEERVEEPLPDPSGEAEEVCAADANAVEEQLPVRQLSVVQDESPRTAPIPASTGVAWASANRQRRQIAPVSAELGVHAHARTDDGSESEAGSEAQGARNTVDEVSIIDDVAEVYGDSAAEMYTAERDASMQMLSILTPESICDPDDRARFTCKLCTRPGLFSVYFARS
jgi:hypothetical protein